MRGGYGVVLYRKIDIGFIAYWVSRTVALYTAPALPLYIPY
jgi:hypothetical protein